MTGKAGSAAATKIASPAGCFEKAIHGLENQRVFFDSIVSTGGRIELFVGWMVLRNDGDVLPWKLLQKLALLKIDLSLCLYSSEQNLE